jgi:hypothetical protein
MSLFFVGQILVNSLFKLKGFNLDYNQGLMIVARKKEGNERK